MSDQASGSTLRPRPVVQVVLQQHAEEAALLRQVRSVLVRAPHVGLVRLGRLDERIAAHLDGLAVAGPPGKALCLAELERPSTGAVFALAVLALQQRDWPLLNHLLALWPAVPEARNGLVSAFGWVPAERLEGVVLGLLASPPGPALELGIEACRMHHADPGPALPAALASPSPTLRAVAARAAAELGRIDLLPQLQSGGGEAPPDLRFWTSWSACLLGDRQQALSTLFDIAQAGGPWSTRALALAMAAATAGQASDWAQHSAQSACAPGAGMAEQRRLVRSVALLGELRFVPWLIEQMAEPALARLAGEAFHWITGADLAALDLETPDAPVMAQATDDAADDGAIDEDDSLPWPDPARVESWWNREQATLGAAASGGRLFLGRPPTLQSAWQVLAEGTQRQRAHAACLVSLLQPGRCLFQVAAPVARQRQALAQLSG